MILSDGKSDSHILELHVHSCEQNRKQREQGLNVHYNEQSNTHSYICNIMFKLWNFN